MTMSPTVPFSLINYWLCSVEWKSNQACAPGAAIAALTGSTGKEYSYDTATGRRWNLNHINLWCKLVNGAFLEALRLAWMNSLKIPKLRNLGLFLPEEGDITIRGWWKWGHEENEGRAASQEGKSHMGEGRNGSWGDLVLNHCFRHNYSTAGKGLWLTEPFRAP